MSRVTIVPIGPAPFCPTAALIIIEPQLPLAQWLAKGAVFFVQVLDDAHLTLIHPAPHRDQHEPEWIQDFYHVVSNIIFGFAGRCGLCGADSCRSDFRTIRPS